MKLSSKFTYHHILRPMLDNGTVTDIAGDYGEPEYSFRGTYTVPQRTEDNLDIIVLANFNDEFWTKHKRLWTQLESQGVEGEWSDEWMVIEGRAYRTEPDCYRWQPSWFYSEEAEEGYVVYGTGDSWDQWALINHIESLVNSPRHAINLANFDAGILIMGGWCRFNGDFNTGWMAGMDDEPEMIADMLSDEDMRAGWGKRDVLFVIQSPSQFYTTWECWYRFPLVAGDDDEGDEAGDDQ